MKVGKAPWISHIASISQSASESSHAIVLWVSLAKRSRHSLSGGKRYKCLRLLFLTVFSQSRPTTLLQNKTSLFFVAPGVAPPPTLSLPPRYLSSRSTFL